MDYSRQAEIFMPEVHGQHLVNIIGCGALGSWVAVQLAKLGVANMVLWDDDIVEEHNLPNQMFHLSHLGKNKAVALAELIESMTGIKVRTKPIRCTDKDVLNGVVFSCVDSMRARTELFRAFTMSPRALLWIEGRMGLREGLVYTVDAGNTFHYGKYRSTLYTDESSELSACGLSQAVGSTACHIASIEVWQYIRYAIGYREQARANETMLDLKDGVHEEMRWKDDSK